MRPNGATSTQPGAERSGTPGIMFNYPIRPERAKALIVRYLHFLHLIYFMLLPFQGAGIVDVDSRGAATLCPGLCACCPVGAHSVQTGRILPMFGL